jgi:hypothetical protein
MNSVILCEGPTDAILLSYYLGKMYGWSYSKKAPKSYTKIETESNQEINWYKRGKDNLLIYGVGGKDNFVNVIKKYISQILQNYPEEDSFSKIIILADKDDKDISEIESLHQQWLFPYAHEVKNAQWIENSFVDNFGNQQTLYTLSIIIPTEKQGALETTLLDAISEDEYDKVIVDQSKVFVNDIRPNAEKYITTDRLALKAHLATVFAVMSPEKVFSRLDNS